MIRIVLTGAECTGKTTLAKALSGYYGEPWTAEFARTYTEQLRRPLTSRDVEPIAKGQLAQEDEGLIGAKQLVIHDTNLLSTILYANHYYKLQLDWLNNSFLRRDYAVYFFCYPDGINWEADSNQRDSEAARCTLHQTFRESLFRLQLPTIELRGEQGERFSEAVSEIDRLLQK